MLETLALALFGLFLLITPGFLFSLVLYPRLGDMDFWKRIGVSVGLSVLLLIYVGFATAKLKMFEARPFLGIVLTLCIVIGFFAYLRGGFEVIIAYWRATLNFLRKFGPRVTNPLRKLVLKVTKPKEPSPQDGGKKYKSEEI